MRPVKIKAMGLAKENTMNRFAPVLLCAVCVAATPAFADPPARHDRHERVEARERQSGDLGEAIISAAERALIGDYYRDHRAEVSSLPPGIRKKVGRGKPLPPGIAQKFPDDLRGRLPARPGYDYRTVGADVVLVETATGVIADVLKGVLNRP